MPKLLIAGRAGLLMAPFSGLFEHSRSVALLVSMCLQKRPGLAGELLSEDVILAAFLHDLGKVNWPEAFFVLPRRKLGKADWWLIRAHPLAGANLAREIGAPEIVVELIRQHHESPGGKGYPQMIEPHRASLLIAACDAYCACLEERPYREPPGEDEAFKEAALRAGEDLAVLVKEVAREVFGKEACGGGHRVQNKGAFQTLERRGHCGGF